MTRKASYIETPWQNDIRKALGARPDIMLWRQHAGKFHPPYKANQWVQVAPDGIADIVGVQLRRFDQENCRIIETVHPNSFQPHDREIQHFYGQAFMIDAKSDTGRPEDSQLDFQMAFKAMCGIYLFAPAPRWDILWAEFGEEPDPLCAAEGQRLWGELKAQRDAEEAAKPVRNTRRRAKR